MYNTVGGSESKEPYRTGFALYTSESALHNGTMFFIIVSVPGGA